MTRVMDKMTNRFWKAKYRISIPASSYFHHHFVCNSLWDEYNKRLPAFYAVACGT